MNNTKKTLKGINAFTLLWYVGLFFVGEKIIEYSIWIIRLLKKWELPNEPFMSKIDLTNADTEISLYAYLILATGYLIFYLFILLGLIQITNSIHQLSQNKIFLKEMGTSFRKAGRFFLVFVIGTFLVDVAALFFSWSSSPIVDLFVTETIVFILLSYLLFFVADILEEGVILKEENELTI